MSFRDIQAMSIDYTSYHPKWKTVSNHIRTLRSGGQCECHGECGVSHGSSNKKNRCKEINKSKAIHFKGNVILTVSHLCHRQHDPMCIEEEHLKAMCQACHLRYDKDFHKSNAARNRLKKLENEGQLILLF